MYGVIDFSRVDTRKGAASAFAPPLDWNGDYVELMRQRWFNDPGARQHIFSVGRILFRKEVDIRFVGPFAADAKEIAERAFKHNA